MKKIIIVGGGIGGLSIACRLLKHEQYNVTIIEKESHLGGRVNFLKNDGMIFDLTASIIIEPDVYTDLFHECNTNYKDYFTMQKLDTLYRVFYDDGVIYDFPYDISKLYNSLEKIEKGLSIQWNKFISDSMKKYIITNFYLLNKPLYSSKEIFNINTLKSIFKLRFWDTSYSFLKKRIKNQKILEYLLFQTMFIGINPYNNTSIYTLIPAITQNLGIGYLDGGMYSYVKALEKLILKLGGTIKKNEKVINVISTNGVIKSVVTDKDTYNADKVIINSDFSYSMKNILPIKNERDFSNSLVDINNYSCSVFVLYLVLKKKYDIKVHNILISKDFKNSIESPFLGEIPTNPSMYIYCKEAINKGNCFSTLNIMVRVPNLSFKNILWDNNTQINMRNIIINRLKQINTFKDINENIISEKYLTPKDLEKKFNCFLGNSFGISSSIKNCLYFRPPLKSTKIDNLYYIGASTHPGNGVSVIIKGTKVLEQIILNDDKV